MLHEKVKQLLFEMNDDSTTCRENDVICQWTVTVDLLTKKTMQYASEQLLLAEPSFISNSNCWFLTTCKENDETR